MFPLLQNEKLIETKVCRQCQASFLITDKDLEFYDKVSPVFNGKKFSIPTPTLCPDCRQQRRLSFRNERKLYKRNCNATGKEIISIYSSDKNLKVYHQDEWWSDRWDPMSYGRDFDFSRSFFEQFFALFSKVPLCQLTTEFSQQFNCDYTNSAGPGKNCYMSFEWAFCENVYYSNTIWNSNDCIDCSFCDKLQNCYACIDCNNCTNCNDAFHCDDCSESSHIYNCKNCHYCTNCDGLENKKFCINNIEYTDLQEYTSALAENAHYNKFDNTLPFGKFYGNEQVEHGYNVTNSKHASYVRDVSNVNDCKYCSAIFGASDVYDMFSWGENASLCYEIEESGRNMYNCIFSWLCWGDIRDLMYSFYCVASSHLFGCIGLRNKQYCILNKQYTKEEYEQLVPKIIEKMQKDREWGEFFPASMSPFGYNETVANEYFPLARDIVIPVRRGGGIQEKGNGSPGHTPGGTGTRGGQNIETFLHGPTFNWSDYEAPFPKVEKIIPASKLPDDISKIPDDILNWAIECEVTGKPFRIIKQELEFYRKHNLPIPRRHPDQRHKDRMELRNPRKLLERKCNDY